MLSVVLPCYNEKDNLEALFSRLDLLAANSEAIEIILVDNGSNDGSDIVFRNELAKRDTSVFKVEE